MSLEIDMLDVSNGDAIVVRELDPLTGREWVGVIDGGETDEDGDKVVEHVRRHTTQEWIDDMVCTHPDADHIGGLSRVVTRLPVGRVWIHDPTNHIDLRRVRASLQRRPGSAARKIERSMQQCTDFLDLLDRRRIPRSEPFAGMTAGRLTVLGPTRDYYRELLTQFEKIEGVFVENERADEESDWIKLSESANPDAVIDEDDTTSAENNSSVISVLLHGSKTLLFTGDAGVQAFDRAVIPPWFTGVDWLDVPHHGSKHNVNSRVLDWLMPMVAYFSAKGTRKHPSRAVINALKRRGCQCFSTHRSGGLLYSLGGRVRPGWGPAEPL
jgi:beta-lactamase superfamily II metal-dependent hydrolase